MIVLDRSVSARTTRKPQQSDCEAGKAPLENGAIVFDGDEITAIGPAERIQIPQGAQVVNAQGKTIIPGRLEGG
jgi:imidazolonepropionase-like amidohydrolase